MTVSVALTFGFEYRFSLFIPMHVQSAPATPMTAPHIVTVYSDSDYSSLCWTRRMRTLGPSWASHATSCFPFMVRRNGFAIVASILR